MGRSLSRAARLRQIEQLLFRKAQGMRVVEIAAACGVDRRTIYRDLELLSDAGVPIWQSDGMYGIVRDQYLTTIRLHFNEAVALYIAARLLSRHSDEHNPHIVSALRKIASAFPDPLAEQIHRTADSVGTRPRDSAFAQVLETVSACWAETVKVRIWYRSPRSGNLHPRDLSPYAIEPSTTGGLYVIGFDDWAGAVRTFKLERLERAERLHENYDIPAAFDLGEHLANAWSIMAGDETEEVRLHFSQQAATFIQERTWHASQQIETHPDGSLTLRVHISDPREMRPWIRSWGSEVQVVAPASLREDIAAEAARTTALYAGENSL